MKDEELKTKDERQEPRTDEEIQKSKRDYGLGIYGSKKRISVKLLDAFIVLLLLVIILLMLFYSRSEGFTVSFDTGIPGIELEDQSVRYGEKVAEPEEPLLPGYSFDGWYLENGYHWDFETDTVGSDTVLYARFSLDPESSSGA